MISTPVRKLFYYWLIIGVGCPVLNPHRILLNRDVRANRRNDVGSWRMVAVDRARSLSPRVLARESDLHRRETLEFKPIFLSGYVNTISREIGSGRKVVTGLYQLIAGHLAGRTGNGSCRRRT